MNEIMSGVATMSSVEMVALINATRQDGEAELRHDNFMAKVPKVLGENEAPKFLGTQKYGNNIERKIYNLPRREAMLMAMSYSYKLQAAVYDRWQELEKPKSALEIIQAQTAILIEQERKLAEHDDRLKRIEAKQQAFEEGVSYFTVLGYAAYKGINVDLSTAQQIGQSATKISKDKGLLVDKVRDPRFGMFNSYHESVLDECIAGLL